MIPQVAEVGFAAFCDVYCDEGYFTVDESRRILEAGLEAGMAGKIHADAYSAIGATQLAAELGRRRPTISTTPIGRPCRGSRSGESSALSCRHLISPSPTRVRSTHVRCSSRG